MIGSLGLAPLLVIAQAETQSDDSSWQWPDVNAWITAGIVIVSSLIVATVVSRTMKRVVARGIGQGFGAIVISRLASYVVFLIGLFYALRVLEVEVGPLIGALGVGGLVVALALQNTVGDFVSSVVLQSRRPYTIGDTVRLDGHLGVVEDIDSRATQLRGRDGTHIEVPNTVITSSTIINLTKWPVRRNKLAVHVTYGTDLRHAYETIHEALQRAPRALEDPEPRVYIHNFCDSSIEFSVRFWHASDRPSQRFARHDVILALHQAFEEESIEFAYPNVVVLSGQENANQIYDVYEGVERVVSEHPPEQKSTEEDDQPVFSLQRLFQRFSAPKEDQT